MITIKEAIERLVCDKFLLLCASQHPAEVDFEEIDMAKYALNKQDKVKPTIFTSDRSDCPYTAYRCPACESQKELYEGQPFCSECGQAIYWSNS